jgi:hypothetical protein
MKVAVVTPTMRYGGLAEQYAHLLRQTRQPDYWIIADDLWEKRYARVFAETSNSPFKVVHYLPRPKPEGYFSDLAGIMNESLDLCAEFEADLIISLQDYIWIQDDGIERFVDLFRGPCEGDLISGLTSHADVPTLDDVVDINDPWTITRTKTSASRQSCSTDVTPGLTRGIGRTRCRTSGTGSTKRKSVFHTACPTWSTI